MALSNFEKFGISLQSVLANQYKYIIGLDLGDGEVTASYWRLDDPVKEPRDLKLVNQGSGYKILSGIYIYDKDGRAIIGTMSQLKNYSEEKGHLFINFKANPRRLLKGELFEGSTVRKSEIVKRFAAETVSAIFQLNTDFDFSGEGILAVGCPSSEDWLKDNRDIEYARLIQEAIKGMGHKLKVMVMPESRASLMKVYKENLESSLRDRLLDGVIVLDAGSSTFDVTYIDFNTNHQFDASIPLGAALIDKRMTRNLLAKKGFSVNDIDNPLQTRLHVRDAKEAYYLDPDNEVKLFIEINEEDVIKAKIGKEFMKNVESVDPVSYSTEADPNVKGPWSNLHHSFLSYCKNQISAHNHGKNFTGVVMLTGGASQMHFIAKNTLDVFPANQAKTVYDTKASFCVSRGLSWATYTDLMALQLISKAKEKIGSTVTTSLGPLRELIAEPLSEIVYNFAQGELENWEKNGDNVTMADLCKKMEQDFVNFSTPQGVKRKTQIDQVVRQAVQKFLMQTDSKSLRGQIVSTINELFKEYFPGRLNEKNLGKIDIKEEDWKSLVSSLSGAGSLNLDEAILSNIDLEAEFAKFTKVVLFLVLTGIYAMGLWMLDAIFDGRISKALDKIVANNRNKLLDADDRKKAVKAFKDKKDKTINSIRSSLVQSILQGETGNKFAKQLTVTLNPIIDKAVDVAALYF